MSFQLLSATLHLLAFSGAVFSGAVVSRQDTEPHDMVDWSQHQFQAPVGGDARGPCPGMNTLANHGFLPRNGSNITIPMAFKAIREGFNMNRDLLVTAAKAGLMASDLDDQFSLFDIGLHGSIEHDASVSRVDINLGDHLSFNESIFTTLANSNPGLDYYNATSAGQVQKARLEDSKAKNPKFRNTIKEFQVRSRESYFYLSTMGDALTGQAPKKFVNILFREERLPLEEGWRMSKVDINRDTHRPVFAAIVKASEWEATPEQCPWLTLAQNAPEDPINEGSIL
ncbi:hypothetical protein V5O48_014036 [Marasmius crinis-equi]|uniref:Heme haloperoxidase family profile domain-containing protein n=1 Tax=Marasmius crinis-equi TaxID=585013 RepID=A0ABR3EYE8_9AGAR